MSKTPRPRIRHFFVLTLLCFVVARDTVAQQLDLTGEWIVSLQAFDATEYQRWTVEAAVPGQLTGTSGSQVLKGFVKGTRVSITLSQRDGSGSRHFQGTMAGAAMEGEVPGRGGLLWRWTATRTPVPPQRPVVHHLEVRDIQPLFSGSVTPALRVFPKDTVQTSTIDVTNKALGDSDKRRSMFASLTGPIYVEGAIPGDTLVVRLNKLRPKASHGFSGSLFDPAAIRPDHYAEALKDGQRQVRWRLDASEGIATPADATGALSGLKVPLRPMLGMIGVAPSGNRAVDPNMLGPWGGNWDYNGVTEGTAVYFPVLHPGALLFLGDGHAAQGDGEIVGTGIEASLDVEITIDLMRNHAIPSPRLETEDDLITLGTHGGLEGALQEATTALTLWLKADYGLSEREIATVLGQTIRYDIASVFARNRVVAAKISKATLKSLKEGR